MARENLPAFDSPQAVIDAITRGRGRGGALLSVVMPRFALREGEVRALLEYLQRVGEADDLPRGVTAGEIRLGVIAPLSGPAAATGDALVSGLRNVFARANSRGGVHGRRIALLEQDGAQGVARALDRLKAQGVYALVGGLWNEDAARVEPLLAGAHMAHVATLVVRSQAPAMTGWSADLLPPLGRQHALLAQHMVRCAEKSAFAITHDGRAAVNLPVSSRVQWLAADAALASRLRGRDRGCVGYTLAQAGAVWPAVPQGWAHALVLPVPAALFEGGAQGQSGLWQQLGGLAAKLTLELLSRAGSGLHERSLLDQVDHLAGYELAAGVPLRFGRTQRYGWEPHVLQLPEGVVHGTPRSMTSMKGD
jgi:hypothetical protein